MQLLYLTKEDGCIFLIETHSYFFYAQFIISMLEMLICLGACYYWGGLYLKWLSLRTSGKNSFGYFILLFRLLCICLEKNYYIQTKLKIFYYMFFFISQTIYDWVPDKGFFYKSNKLKRTQIHYQLCFF